MNVQVKKDGSETVVTIVLDRQDLAILDQLVACGGTGAGASAPNSPLRNAGFRICQRLFRRESLRQPFDPKVEYRLARG